MEPNPREWIAALGILCFLLIVAAAGITIGIIKLVEEVHFRIVRARYRRQNGRYLG